MDASGTAVLAWEPPVIERNAGIIKQWLSKPNLKPRIQCGFGLGMLSPRVVNLQLDQEFVPYSHHIIYSFETVLVKKDFSCDFRPNDKQLSL